MNNRVMLSVLLAMGAGLQGCAQEQKVSFQADVQPILAQHCMECHTPPDGKGYAKSGLSMVSHEALMSGTRFGPVVVPGDSLSSTLNRLVEGRADPSLRMPHGGAKLSDAEIEILALWVNQGARND